MNLGKISAGISVVVFTCGIILGIVLVGFGNGINSNVSDSGGGIEFAVGFMIIGAGYLIIGGSVLYAAIALIAAAIAFLVRWVRTKRRDEMGSESKPPMPPIPDIELLLCRMTAIDPKRYFEQCNQYRTLSSFWSELWNPIS